MISGSSGLVDVGVYVGHGASHSWIWFADLCDREEYFALSFLDENDVKNGKLSGCRNFFISGGDTFAIASALGKEGAREIEHYVSSGGTYLGTCAGAYLPLKSSLPPLNLFNFVSARITNLTKNLPAPVCRPEKYCTCYGCRYVYHPVREEVVLKYTALGGEHHGEVKAPLYGGPAIEHSKEIESMAEYLEFTDQTEYLVDPDCAAQTLIGHVAVARKEYGKGQFYLFGPHFEHPEYTRANSLLMGMLQNNNTYTVSDSISEVVKKPVEPTGHKRYLKFLSLVSNARIIALALERTTYQWLIGKKVYEPEKIRVFLEAVWTRAQYIRKINGYNKIEEDDIEIMTKLLDQTTVCLKLLKTDKNLSDVDSNRIAEELFSGLREATAKFLTIYFRLRRYDQTEHERRLGCTCISRQQEYSILLH